MAPPRHAARSRATRPLLRRSSPARQAASAAARRRPSRPISAANRPMCVRRFVRGEVGRWSKICISGCRTACCACRWSDLAKAMRYVLRHSDGLILYLDDGRLEMDTNVVERAGHQTGDHYEKEFLVRGQRCGARRWAIASTLIQTCKLNSGFCHGPRRRCW
jgi:transposase IS66 family protein